MSKTIKILPAVVLVLALLYWFYSMGGPQPVETVEQPVVGAPAEDSGE